MRFVHGHTLYELIAKGPLEPSRAVNVIGQVAAALDAAHAAGLTHRDVKPERHSPPPPPLRTPSIGGPR